MRYKLFTPLSLALTSVLMMASNLAYAIQCDELYPQDSDSDYYNLHQPRVAKETYLELNNLADQLDGRWHGTGIEVNCGVSDGESLAIVENFDIDAEIEQHFLGSIIVRAEKESKRKVALDRIFLSPQSERELEKIRQGYEPELPSYTVEFSSPNTLVFDHKYRASNGLPSNDALNPYWITSSPLVDRARRLVHEIKTVSLDNDQLNINRDVYVNGHFVSQQEWQLKRR